jgi:hypothetical protein
MQLTVTFLSGELEIDHDSGALKDCRHEYLPEFLRLHRSRIDRETLEALDYQLAHGTSYYLRTDA